MSEKILKPPYPQDILPRQGWTVPISTDDLLKDCPNLLIGHMLRGSVEQCIDMTAGEDMPCITRSSLPLERMANLSCCFLGSYFLISYFHFLPDNEGEAAWKEEYGMRCDLITEDNYTHYPVITVVGWLLREIENRRLPYPKVFSKQSDFEENQLKAINVAEERNCQIAQQEWQNLKCSEENKKQRIAEFIGESRCNHAPTMLNYWHSTIDIYTAFDNVNPVKKISSGWSKKLAVNLQDYLCRSFVLLKDESKVPHIANDALWVKQ